MPFKKNRNEAAYFDGKKHFIDVIKNTGDSSFLIWRQPEEDFNTHSKLIVMPGETAVFVDGGNVVQTFEEGTYELRSEKLNYIRSSYMSACGMEENMFWVMYLEQQGSISSGWTG